MCQSLSPCHWLESLRQKVAREALSQQSSPREVETSAPTHPATIIKNKITRPTPAPPALYVPSAAPEHPRIPLPHRPPLPPPFLFIPPYFFFFKHFFFPSLLSPFLPPTPPLPSTSVAWACACGALPNLPLCAFSLSAQPQP